MTHYLGPFDLPEIRPGRESGCANSLEHSLSRWLGLTQLMDPAGILSPPSLLCVCFSQEGTASAARSAPWAPRVVMLPNEMGPRVLKLYWWVRKPFLLQSPSTGSPHSREVRKSTGGGDFLNVSHGYYISCVCMCVWTSKYSGFSLSSGSIFISSSWKDILLILSSEKKLGPLCIQLFSIMFLCPLSVFFWALIYLMTDL